MVLLIAALLAAGAPCVVLGDSWPVKAKLAYATRFSIAYQDNFKFVRFLQDTGDSAHVLYTGSAPDLGPIATKYGINQASITAISVPVSTVGITSTLLTPFLEVLGETGALKATKGADLEGEYRIASACVNKMYSEGLVTKEADTDALNARGLGAVFSDTCPGQWSGPCANNAAIFSWEAEATMASWGEYVQLAAAYFNKESEGLALAASIHDSFECVKTSMAAAILEADVVKPKVLWAYQYLGTWYATLADNTYKGEVTAAAGGVMVGKGFSGAAVTENAYGGMSGADFLELAKQADVLIYDSNYTEAYGTPAIRALLEQLPAFTNKRIFDIYQLGNNWFERRIIMPDILAQDMLIALHPTIAAGLVQAGTPPAGLTFLRDVFTQADKGKEALFPDPESCTDVSATVVLPASVFCPDDAEAEEDSKDGSKSDETVLESDLGVALVVIALVVAALGLVFAIRRQKAVDAAEPSKAQELKGSDLEMSAPVSRSPVEEEKFSRPLGATL